MVGCGMFVCGMVLGVIKLFGLWFCVCFFGCLCLCVQWLFVCVCVCVFGLCMVVCGMFLGGV